MRLRPGMPMLLAVTFAGLAFALLWPLPLERPRSVIVIDSDEVYASFSPDSQTLITVETKRPDDDGRALDFGRRGSESVSYRNADDGAFRWAHEPLLEPPYETCLVTPDSTMIARLDESGRAEFRDAASGKVVKTQVASEQRFTPSHNWDLNYPNFHFGSDGRLRYLDEARTALRYVDNAEVAVALSEQLDRRTYRMVEGPRLFEIENLGFAGDDELYRYWITDLGTGASRRSPTFKGPMERHMPFSRVCGSSDGRLLAVTSVIANDQTCCLVNTETWTERTIELPGPAAVAVLSQDGNVIASPFIEEPPEVPVAETLYQQVVSTVRKLIGELPAHRPWVSLCRTSDGGEIARLPGLKVAFAPDGHTLALVKGRGLELWDYPLRPAWLLRLSIAAAVGGVGRGLLRWRRWAKASRAA